MKSIKYAFVVVALSLFAAGTATALTGGITIQGKVNPVFTFDVTYTAGELVLDNGNLVNVAIGSATETSNAKKGYTVSVASQNNWQLTGTDSAPIAYSIQYDGVAPGTGGVLIDTTANTGKTGKARAITLTTTGLDAAEMPDADTYSDTLTFTMTAK